LFNVSSDLLSTSRARLLKPDHDVSLQPHHSSLGPDAIFKHRLVLFTEPLYTRLIMVLSDANQRFQLFLSLILLEIEFMQQLYVVIEQSLKLALPLWISSGRQSQLGFSPRT
jgi:hypothetical protein